MPKSKAATGQGESSARKDLPRSLPDCWVRLADRIRLEWRESWFPERHLVFRTAQVSRTVLATMTIVPVLEPAEGRILERISVNARTVFPDDTRSDPAGRIDMSFTRELDDAAALLQAEAELKMRYVALLAERESRGDSWEHLLAGVVLAQPAEADIAGHTIGLSHALEVGDRFT